MTVERETLRNIMRGVKNYTADNPDGLYREHEIVERALLHGAEVAGVSHCGVETMTVEGTWGEQEVFYLNFGDIYNDTVMIFFAGGIAGLHRIRIGSVGNLLERSL